MTSPDARSDHSGLGRPARSGSTRPCPDQRPPRQAIVGRSGNRPADQASPPNHAGTPPVSPHAALPDPNDGQVLPPVPAACAGGDGPPRNALDLFNRCWNSMALSRTLQLAFLLAVIFTGLGYLVHQLTGTSPLCSAVGAAIGGASAVGTRKVVRRKSLPADHDNAQSGTGTGSHAPRVGGPGSGGAGHPTGG
jgi:hypothetical protein